MGRVTPLNKLITGSKRIETDDRAVRERIRDWYRCWPQGEMATAGAPLTAPGSLRLLSDFGRDVAVTRTLKDYRQLWQPILEDTFKRWHISIVSAINLRCTPEMAAAHFFTELSGVTHENGAMNQVQAVSQVWEKITGRWHLVQEHSTVHDAPV